MINIAVNISFNEPEVFLLEVRLIPIIFAASQNVFNLICNDFNLSNKQKQIFISYLAHKRVNLLKLMIVYLYAGGFQVREEGVDGREFESEHKLVLNLFISDLIPKDLINLLAE